MLLIFVVKSIEKIFNEELIYMLYSFIIGLMDINHLSLIIYIFSTMIQRSLNVKIMIYRQNNEF